MYLSSVTIISSRRATIERISRIIDVSVGPELLERLVDALGNPIDGKGPINASGCHRAPLKAPGVLSHCPVNQPMMTSIEPIDTMVPIGRGRHELIVGDRQTRKTAAAIKTILNQRSRAVSTSLLVCSRVPHAYQQLY